MTKQLITAETSSKTEVANLTRSWGWEPPRIAYASRIPPRHMLTIALEFDAKIVSITTKKGSELEVWWSKCLPGCSQGSQE